MPSSLPRQGAERARPLLGTIVSVRVQMADDAACDAAIEAAFAEIALVHALMSFHEDRSELSGLHRGAARAPVAVDARTFEVLAWALELARLSEGVFDPVRAAALAVKAGALPRPRPPAALDPEASWRDVELIAERSAVAFRRPLLLDLGGVAKGYAVDRAIEALSALGVRQACINAGGDLRVIGPEPELVALAAPPTAQGALAMIELQDAALASSGGDGDRERAPGMHFDGRSRAPAREGRFASVMAPSCMLADSLTKLVMAQGEASAELLTRLGAGAWLFEPEQGWLALAEAA